MRIAYILNTLATGGAERLMVAIARHMIARGHVVEFVILRTAAAGQVSAPLPVHHLDIDGPLDLPRATIGGVRILRSFRPDVIHSNNFHGNLLARAMRIFLPSAHLISTIHNVHEGGPLRMLALRLSDSLSDCTVAVCRATAEQAIRDHAATRSKCSVIPIGIDCAEFAPDPLRRTSMRAQAGLAGEFIWLATGRLVPAKDYPNLLRAFTLIHAASSDARLWIAGEGNTDYVALLRTFAGHLGIGAFVHWLGLRRDVPALLDLADGFVLASAWEGMPLALGEAMAMDKAIASTDVGGVRELASECALVVPAGSPQALAAAMLRLMHASPDPRRKEDCSARQRILKEFSIEKSAAQWEALYYRVLAARAAHS